ncbi:hypothetical protein AX17_004265 [Amanita inopinata Kibby_2008]|nr:hypothetical protein AX17_004265 [Amanita inopinata Kibby_2008]
MLEFAGTTGNILKESCDLSGCNSDRTTFKGIWMMHLQYFLDAAADPTLTALYAPWVGYQTRAITNNAQDSSGDVGNVWAPGGTELFGPEVIGMAISAGNIASKYGTTNGSFTC